MEIKVWYSKSMKQWRWTLLERVTLRQESGQQYHIRDAMNDIATTIEYMVEKREYEGQD
tara:strand:- start:12 stop:188 length:177 start_codon:yes stop_codon:yes gene_type:complete